MIAQEQGGLRPALSLVRGKKGKVKMTKIFSINNKTYQAKEFDFNLLCDLEEMGLSLDDIEKKPMSLIRTYLMFSAGISKEQAGKEIEEHIAKGGEITDIISIMSEMMSESGFFRSINKKATESEGETSTKNRKNNAKE